MAALTKVRFVRQLPVKDGGHVDVTVGALTQERAWWWDANIQPEIDRLIESKVVKDRADLGWRWPWITTMVAAVLPQRPRAWSLLVPGNGPDGLVPSVMIALVRRIGAFDDENAKSAFLWYVAAAPKQALAPFVPRLPGLLGQAGLDIAVCEAFEAGHDGRLALHADKEGNNELLNWYAEQGMVKYPKGKPLPFIFKSRRKNDGRYFYCRPDDARTIYDRNQLYR